MTQLSTTKETNPASFGENNEILSFGKRLKALMPGGEKLSDMDAAALAQAAYLTNANPFVGELYAFSQKGQLNIVEGYKLLIRYAKQTSDYIDKYHVMTPEEREAHGLQEGDIGVVCRIFRLDRTKEMSMLIKAGMNAEEAMNALSTESEGIVLKKDTTGKYGPIDPPKGWSWLTVANKRALKNALRRAYAMPSLQELAQSREWDKSYQELKDMPFEERVTLLRGEDDKLID